jgi:hypothetical protein
MAMLSVPITTLTMGPLNNYSNISNDPCYMIENVLFDVESRLKRCEPDTKGNLTRLQHLTAFPDYRELFEEGRRLREEWTQASEQMRDNKPPEEHPDYDLSKCIVMGRTRRSQANEDAIEVEY